MTGRKHERVTSAHAANRSRLRFALLQAAVLLLCSTGAGAQSDVAAVGGRVVNAAGAALAGFPVLVGDGSGREIPLRTGKDGRFQTLGLAWGPVTVRLDAQGYAPAGVRCRIPAGRTAYVELVAATAITNAAPAANCRLEPVTSDLYVID